MPRYYNEMPADVLLVMAASGDQEAREERVIREIMAVDKVEWPTARQTFLDVLAANRRFLFVATIPYKVGILCSFTAGIVSFPLIFHLDTVLVFNEVFVTTDVPEERDLETPLEVGAWAMNWMEAPLGQISFFLLCMQYARAQLENLGAKVRVAAPGNALHLCIQARPPTPSPSPPLAPRYALLRLHEWRCLGKRTIPLTPSYPCCPHCWCEALHGLVQGAARGTPVRRVSYVRQAHHFVVFGERQLVAQRS